VRSSGAPTWISDLATDPSFIRNRFGRPLEAASAFAFPVLSRRGVAAVLEFFSAEWAAPDERLLDVMADVGTQLGRVVDRVDARRDVEAGKQRLERIIETSGEAFIGMGESGLVTYWNAAAERMFGLSRAEALGRSLAETVVPPRHREAHRDGLARFLATGERRVLDQRIELRSGRSSVADDVMWRRDGTSFPVEYACAPVIGDTGIEGVIVTFTDISERREVERALRAAYEHERATLAKLTELDEAKSNFLATVSHELRTPLTSLTGYLELLVEGDVGEVTEGQRRVLGTMSRNADRLRALIEDLLTVSNIEARPLVLAPVEIALSELIEQSAAVVAEASERRGHELRVEVDPAIGTVRVDPVQFRRVLTSLIDNAIKCTPPGGRIEVKATTTDGGVRISVCDNGIGIDPGEVPRLFTRFFRTNAATQLAIQGAGLSLAIARQIVDGHGGSIAVDTSPGEGATFTVSLPAS
jgi:PAS domain S-box-containing protein